MVDLRVYIEKKVCDIMSYWNESDIYAISFLVYSNESFEYNGYSNVTEFSVSYNTERDCAGKDELTEERWNYAFWRQNEVGIVEAVTGNEGMELLFQWYEENGICNIGRENYDACYDDEMRYIGQGPVGYKELLEEVTAVAKKLQDSGFVREILGKSIPIIIHDLEYSWYTIEATQKANSHGEADKFLATMKRIGVMN